MGCASAKEVATAIQKSVRDAKKNLVKINLTKDASFPHFAEHSEHSAKIMLRPAAEGTGDAQLDARLVGCPEQEMCIPPSPGRAVERLPAAHMVHAAIFQGCAYACAMLYTLLPCARSGPALLCTPSPCKQSDPAPQPALSLRANPEPSAFRGGSRS